MIKIILFSLLAVSVLGVGIIQAEAYDGKIRIDTDKRQYFDGDIVTLSGFIMKSDPIPNELVTITIVDRNTGFDIETVSVEIADTSRQYKDTDEFVWDFNHSIDTMDSKWEVRTVYDIITRYDDVVLEGHNFSIDLPLEQQSSGIPEALREDSKQRLDNLERENLELKQQIMDLNKRIDGLLLIIQEQISVMMNTLTELKN